MKFKADEFLNARRAIETATYTAASTDGDIIDTQGHGEALVVVNVGTSEAAATGDVTVRESDNADGSSSSAITGAAFAQFSTANDRAQYVGRIDLEKRKRYLFARLVTDGAKDTVLGASMILIPNKALPAEQAVAVSFSV